MSKAIQPAGDDNHLDTVYTQVRDILAKARGRAWQAVNAAMVNAYWQVGRAIVEEEQRGERRAGYGQSLIKGLSERLTAEFGQGFGLSQLKDMRAFYVTFPKSHAVRGQLTWTHYRLLMRVPYAHTMRKR